MSRTLKTMGLCLLLCACLAVSALAAEPEALAGWEDWDTADYGSHVVMTCREKNRMEAEILADVSALITENQGVIGADYRQFQMKYYYTRPANTFSGVVNLMSRRVIPTVGGLWPCPETYAAVSVAVGKTNSEYTLCLTVDINGGNGEMTALYQKLKEVGDAAKASAETVAGQLHYINVWLGTNTAYRNSGAPHENEAYGAIIDGRAVCGGYAEAVTLFCRYLGVIGVTVRSPSHIWNSVLVDGAWKHWDATWSVGSKYFLVNNISDATGAHAYDRDVCAEDQQAARMRAEYYNAPAELYAAARALNEMGVLRGDSNGFSLNAPLTRAQLAAILTRIHCPQAAQEVPTGIFTDAPDWAASCIEWCVRESYLLPASVSTFGSDVTGTLSELATAFGSSPAARDGIALRADIVLQAIKAV